MGFSAAAVAKIRQIVKTVAKFKIGWKRSGTVVSLANSGDTVGIGTSDPVSHLEVASADSVVSLTVRSDSANDAALDLIEETADSAGFGTADAYGFRTVYDGSTNKLLIKSGQQTTVATRVAIQRSDGAVGIGTDSPIAELDVAGKIAITAESSTPAQPSDGEGYLYSKSDGKIYWRSHDLSETDLTATGGGGGGTDVGWTGPSSGVISTTGSTGLGSTAPDRKLEITNGTTELLTRLTYNDTNGSATNYVDLGVDSGGAFIVSPSEAAASGITSNYPIQLYNGGASSDNYHLAIDANEIQAKADDSTAGALYLQYYGGNLAVCDGGGTLTAGGQVGIGAAVPGAQLEVEVADSANTTGVLIDFNETGGYTALEVDSESTVNYAAAIQGKYGLTVIQDITSGRGLKVSRNIDETGSLALAYFLDDHVTNTRPTMIVQQDGTGDIISLYSGSSQVVAFTNEGKLGIGDTTPDAQLEVEVADAAGTTGVLIDFNETGGYNALKVDTESTTYFGASVYGKYGVRIEQDLSSGQALYVTRNVVEAGSYALAYFHDDSTSNTQTTLQVRQDGSGDILNLFDGAVEKVTVTGDGKIGVGVTDPEGLVNIKNISIDPLVDVGDPAEYHLHIQGSSTTGKAAGIAFGNSAGNVGSAIVYKDTGGYAQGELQFYTKTSTSTGVDPVQRMVITHDGNVGIGIAEPTQPLHVETSAAAAYVKLSRNDSMISDGEYLSAIQFAGTENGTDYGNSVQISAMATENWTYGLYEGAELAFWTTSNGSATTTRRMTIAAGGNVGIGTATPKVPLDLYEMGGLSVAMTYVHPSTYATYTLTSTEFNVPSADWKVTFTAPANGKIEISTLFFAATAGGSYIWLGLSDNSTYNTLGAEYEVRVAQVDETDDVMINCSWLLTGLTAGTSYTYYIGARKPSGETDVVTFAWGGDNSGEFPALIIKALTVPDTIYTG